MKPLVMNYYLRLLHKMALRRDPILVIQLAKYFTDIVVSPNTKIVVIKLFLCIYFFYIQEPKNYNEQNVTITASFVDGNFTSIINIEDVSYLKVEKYQIAMFEVGMYVYKI